MILRTFQKSDGTTQIWKTDDVGRVTLTEIKKKISFSRARQLMEMEERIMLADNIIQTGFSPGKFKNRTLTDQQVAEQIAEAKHHNSVLGNKLQEAFKQNQLKRGDNNGKEER